MAPAKRKRSNANLPPNVYANRGAFVWRHPVTGKKYGLGNNRQSAFAQAHEANLAVLDLLEKPRLVHRIFGQPETLTDWIAEYKTISEKRFGAGMLAKSTLASRHQKCNTISERIGGTLLKSTSTRTIAGFLAEYAGKPRMAQAMRSLLLDIFREAIAAGWCERNPVDVTRAEAVSTKRARLSLDQFMLIYRGAQEHSPEWMAHALELAILTAQRRGDLANLKYTDIANGCLNVTQQKNRRTDTIGHRVAIPMELTIAGFSLAETVGKTRNVVSRYLIHHTKQAGQAKVGSAVRVMSLSSEFARLRDIVGIAGDNPPTLHEVRSLAARLYTERHGKAFANALLGHKSAQMTELYLDERDGWFRPKMTG